MSSSKVCARCGGTEWKLKSKGPGRPKGLRCVNCIRVRRRLDAPGYRSRHPEVFQRARDRRREAQREYVAEWKKRNPMKVASYQLSRRRDQLPPEKVGAWRERIVSARLKRFGITRDDYDRMLAAQGGVCKICRQVETVERDGRVKLLAVDHDHSTGAIRGLLCQGCNRCLGHFERGRRRRWRHAASAAQYLGTKA